MLQGSSAFTHNEEVNSHSTPKIRVTLTNNVEMGDWIAGGSRADYGYGDDMEYTTLFKGYWQTVYDYPPSTPYLVARDYSTYQTIAGTSVKLGATVTNFYFNNLGDTLELWYIDNWNTVRKIVNSGGTVWGSSALIHSGGSRMADIVVSGGSKYYVLEEIYQPPAGTFNNRVKLVSRIHNGTTWIKRDVYTKRMYTDPGVFDLGWYDKAGLMNICKDSAYDDIILKIRGDSPFKYYPVPDLPARYLALCGLKVVRTDGYRIYKDFDIIDTKDLYDINGVKVTQAPGDSLYILPINEIDYVALKYKSDDKTVGNFDQSPVYYSTYLQRNKEGRWSNLKPFTGNQEKKNDNIGQDFYISSAYKGDTPTILTNLFFSTPAKLGVRRQDVSLDVSGDLMSYNNTDNRRISLTLGNYK